jgi:hypothetical protein
MKKRDRSPQPAMQNIASTKSSFPRGSADNHPGSRQLVQNKQKITLHQPVESLQKTAKSSILLRYIPSIRIW